MNAYFASKAMTMSGLRPRDRVVLFHLCDIADDSGLVCTRLEYLSGAACISRKAVLKALRSLRKRGLILHLDGDLINYQIVLGGSS